MAKDLEAKVRLTGDGKDADRAIKKTESGLKRLANYVKSRFVITFSEAASAIRSAFDQIAKAATLESQTEALRRNLAQQGVAFDDFIAKLKEVSDAQISTADLIQSSGKAIVLGIPAEQIAELLDVARASAIALGTDVSSAFDDLVTGLARRSLPILDNLGFTTRDLQKALDDFATQAGTTADKLSALQQSQALLNGILELGKERIERYGDAQTELAKALAQGQAAFKDFQNTAGQFAGSVALALGSVTLTLTNYFISLGEGVLKAGQALAYIGTLIPGISDRSKEAAAAMKEWDDQADTLQERLGLLSKQMSDAADIALKAAFGFEEESAATKQLSDAQKALSETQESALQTTEKTTDSVNDLGDAFEGTALDAIALTRGFAGVDEGLRNTGRLVVTMTGQFEALRAVMGETAAIQAALAGGGQLTQGGTRIRLARGGSRLVSSQLGGGGGLFPGLSGATYTVTGVNVRQLPNGRIVTVP